MVVVQYILPAIRAAVSRELVEKHGLRKSHVAELMGLTPAAITQYFNRSRGDNLETLLDSEDIKGLVSELADEIIRGDSSPDLVVLQMCRICSVLRSEGIICELHMEQVPQLRNISSCACAFGLIE
jgi:predicted transcriptional regulator